MATAPSPAREAPAHRRASCVLPRLETFLQRHIPGATSDIVVPLVIVGFRRRGKRRILVEHIVHAKRDGRIIEPCAPAR